jgi:hypothetical protein
MFKKFQPYLLAILVFIIIAFAYSSPILSGKQLNMHDINMSQGSAKEVDDFHKTTGEWAWWTNSMFGGMPSYMIAGDYENSLPTKLGAFYMNHIPTPVNVLFLLMLGFFILMRVLKVDTWLGVMGAIAYAFGTYNLLFIEAGHISKEIALAFVPALLAGFIAIFRGRYWLGIALTTFFTAMEFYGNHPQITYYLFFLLGIYVVYESYLWVKHGKFAHLLKSYAFIAISVLVGMATHAMHLWNNYDYSKESTRGKSELTLGNIKPSDGLDRDYALAAYNYGILESLTLATPNFMGGALGKSSETFKTLTRNGVGDADAKQFVSQMPTYFGPQGGTSGPAYSGAIICFLFILGLFIVKDRFKFVLLGITLLYLMISWGSNFSSFNYFMFDYFPYFNKFRAVNMTMTLVHFCLVLGAVLAVKEIMDEKFSFEKIKKPVLFSLGILFGILLVGYFMLDFRSANDEGFKTNLAQAFGGNKDVAQQVLNSLISDRGGLVLGDIFRSFIFVVLAISAIWLFIKNKANSLIFNGLLIFLVLFDMFQVDKRYFNNDDFVPKHRSEETFTPSPANEQILQDKDPDFRVLNTTVSFWQDANDSYFHKSIGGYHGAKLKRIQELYDHQMVKDGKLNLTIYNMLNTKYFIVDAGNGVLSAQKNPAVLGNAWFVNSVKIVKNADEEMKSLDNFNPRQVAFIDTRFEEFLKGKNMQGDTTSTIKLTEYKPNHLIYVADAKKEGVAVFSEIYYRGNIDWKSYIDGQEVPHFRANYVLRAMVLPAGNHKIEFIFKPKSVENGTKIDLFASILMVLFVAGAVFMEVRNKQN